MWWRHFAAGWILVGGKMPPLHCGVIDAAGKSTTLLRVALYREFWSVALHQTVSIAQQRGTGILACGLTTNQSRWTTYPSVYCPQVPINRDATWLDVWESPDG